jgi:hypothetical protein
MGTNYRILRPGLSQVTGQLSRSPASKHRHAALTWNSNSDGNFHFRASGCNWLASAIGLSFAPGFSLSLSLLGTSTHVQPPRPLPSAQDVFLFLPVRRVERRTANSGTFTAGTFPKSFGCQTVFGDPSDSRQHFCPLSSPFFPICRCHSTKYAT